MPNCSRCGVMIQAKKRELPLLGQVSLQYDKPIQAGGDVYCNAACASVRLDND